MITEHKHFTMKDRPASERPYEKCLEYGAGSLSDGELLAVITWSSSYYDFMIVEGEKILPVNTEGNSSFEVPLKSVARLSDTSQTAPPSSCR